MTKWDNEPEEFKHLSQRVRSALREKNCLSFEDAANLDRGEWLRIPNFGIKSLAELLAELDARNLWFGMEEPELPPPLPMDEVSILHRRLDLAMNLIRDLQDRLQQLRRDVTPMTWYRATNDQRAAAALVEAADKSGVRLLHNQRSGDNGSCERE